MSFLTMVACAIAAPFLVAACASTSPLPVAPPRFVKHTRAVATKGMSVRWRAPSFPQDFRGELRMNIAVALDYAGYTRVTTHCAVDLEIAWARDGADYRSIKATLRNPSNIVIDTLELSFRPGEAPVSQPGVLAILIVNAMNDSTKLAQANHVGVAGPFMVLRDGIVVLKHDDAAIIDARAFDALSTPRESPVDVTIESQARWPHVVIALDALRASGRNLVRINVGDDSAEVSLVPPEPWSGKQSWVSVWLSTDGGMVANWQSDLDCNSVPKQISSTTRQLQRFQNMMQRQCQVPGCFDRLVVGGEVADAPVYLSYVIVAARARHVHPLPLDVHGSEPIRKCGAQPLTWTPSEIAAFHACAPNYHGVVRGLTQIEGDDVVLTMAFIDQQNVTDREMTCIAEIVGAANLADPNHVKRSFSIAF